MDLADDHDQDKSADSDSVVWLTAGGEPDRAANTAMSLSRRAKSIETLSSLPTPASGLCVALLQRSRKAKPKQYAVAKRLLNVGASMACPAVSVLDDAVSDVSAGSSASSGIVKCVSMDEMQRDCARRRTPKLAAGQRASSQFDKFLSPRDASAARLSQSRSECDMSRGDISDNEAEPIAKNNNISQKINNAFLRLRRKSFSLESRRTKAVCESMDEGVSGRYTSGSLVPSGSVASPLREHCDDDNANNNPDSAARIADITSDLPALEGECGIHWCSSTCIKLQVRV